MFALYIESGATSAIEDMATACQASYGPRDVDRGNERPRRVE